MIDHPMTTLDLTDLYRLNLQAQATREQRARAAQPVASRRFSVPAVVVRAASRAHGLPGWRPAAWRSLALRRGAVA